MGISSPVFGFRPGRLFLSRKSKFPKPESLTCSPTAKAALRSSKKESTSSRASRLFKPSSLNNDSAMFAFVNAITQVGSDSLFRSYRRTELLLELPHHGAHLLIGVLVGKGAGGVLQKQA